MKRILILILVSFFSCDDIIEVEDISQNTITVLAPTNTSILAEGDITFSWDGLQDATQYRLQIATPTFENASQILLDSTITATNFSKTLELGNYEWRIRAENSEYQTLYTTQNFSVEE